MKIWNVVWPLIIYSAAQIVVTLIGVIIFGAREEYAVGFILAAALLCIPIYYRMYQKDGQDAQEEKPNIPMSGKDYFVIILCGATLAVAMNNLIAITPLPVWFPGYEETNEVIFGGGMLLQILSAGIFGCIVEEMSHRGVTYLRMKRYWGKKKAIVLSALLFGIYHMNMVQAVYTFVLGLFFAWVYERYQSLWAPIIAHMSANLCVILLGSSTLMLHVLEGLVGYCLVTCISALLFYYGWRYLKQTNPIIELEFIEKEPDTLKKLTEEYKEQEKGERRS